MEPSSWAGLAGVVLLTALAAYGSAVDAAMLSMRPSRLRQLAEGGSDAAAAIASMLENERRHAAQVVTLALIAATASTALAAASLAGELSRTGLPSPVAVFIVTALVALSHVAIAARLGRRAGRRLGEGLALTQARPLQILLSSLKPMARFADWVADLGLALAGRRPEAEEIGELVELRDLIAASEREEAISEEDVEMISGVLDISREQVRHIMTPRPDMVMVAATDSAEAALTVALNNGYSRLPVYTGDHDQITGMVSVRQIAAALIEEGNGRTPVGKLAQSAFFVPETKMVDDLLSELQAGRTHMAIAIDEYGDTAGLVTLEDIIERIVGDIRDETDRETIEISRDDEGRYLVDGRVRLSQLAEATGIELKSSDADTISGLVFLDLGHVPDNGEKLVIDGFGIEVALVENNRIRQLRITPAGGRQFGLRERDNGSLSSTD